MGDLRVLLNGDADMNALDGSAIWVQSTAQTLAAAGCHVTVLLRTPVRTRRLLEPLEALPEVHIVRPFEDRLWDARHGGDRLTAQESAALMRRLDEPAPFDVVLVRGFELASRVVYGGGFGGRLWAYLTDFPQSIAQLNRAARERLTDIALASRFLLCQTEELRDYLEAVVPAACGRCVLFPPVVQGVDLPAVPRTAAGTPLRLVYTGKFAPGWKTLEMTRLPGRLAALGIPAELHAIGDKVQEDPADPSYRRRMLRALRSAPGVVWEGGQSREETIRRSAGADLGLGWRDRALDASLELSTKVLEYGSVGLPVVLNRTPMHEQLLGPEYPLFGRTEDDVVAVIAAAARDEALYRDAAARCFSAAERFSATAAERRLRALLATAFPSRPATVGAGTLRVGLAGHDLATLTLLVTHLRALPGVEVRVDDWASRDGAGAAPTPALAGWADAMICVGVPAALAYQGVRRPGQRLVIRPRSIDDAFAALVSGRGPDDWCVFATDREAESSGADGWPAERLAIIPAAVDLDQLDRPKLDGARFHLGLLGSASELAMEVALEVLARVRDRDPRFQLFVRAHEPSSAVSWGPHQREPGLREAVVLETPGPDLAAWLRRIGWLLDPTGAERPSPASAEAMASGAVPVLLAGGQPRGEPRARWRHRDAASMARAILALATLPAWEAASSQARQEVLDASAGRVAAAWLALLVDGRAYAPADRARNAATTRAMRSPA